MSTQKLARINTTIRNFIYGWVITLLILACLLTGRLFGQESAAQRLETIILTDPRVTFENVKAAGGEFGRRTNDKNPCPASVKTGLRQVKLEYHILFHQGEAVNTFVGCYDSHREAGAQAGRLTDLLEASALARISSKLAKK